MRRRDFLAGAVAGPGLGLIRPFRRIGPSGGPAAVMVKVLGTAQDGGVPQIGCQCPNCARARRDPRYRRLIASLAVADLELPRFVLIDATPDVRAQAESAVAWLGPEPPGLLEALGGIVLTHAHIGHYTGLMFFGYESAAARRLPVYASRRMADFLAANGPWSQLVKLENIDVRRLAPGGPAVAVLGRVRLRAFAVPHRDEYTDTLGLRIEGPRRALLYIPDIQSWEAWPGRLEAELDRADLALLDGTFFSSGELPGRDMAAIGHPPIRETMRRLESLPASRKAKIFFTHLNHTNPVLDPAGEARRELETAGFGLAEDGQELVL
jgi:pyrroloquinoline quinone biosynthesis protein B